jgi:endonuclease/exonuclease/phosphatase (EEP) superfamily protein YafD
VTLAGLLEAAGVLTCGLTLAGFVGPLFWLLDLASHFRPQYAVLLVVAGAAAFVRRQAAAGVGFALFAAVNGLMVISSLWTPSASPGAPTERLRLVVLNVHTANRQFDRVKAYLLSTRPDVAVLAEVDELWMAALKELQRSFPYQVAEARDDNFGIALLSRLPLDEAAVIALGAAEVPSVMARVGLANRPVTLLGTHPVPPYGARGTRLRDDQLAAVAQWVRGRNTPVILCGDLNATPWCSVVRRLRQDSGLRHHSPKLRLHATWPAQFWPLRIPIDHCLVTSELQVVRKEVGPRLGSDHLPLLVEVSLAEAGGLESPQAKTNAP